MDPAAPQGADLLYPRSPFTYLKIETKQRLTEVLSGPHFLLLVTRGLSTQKKERERERDAFGPHPRKREHVSIVGLKSQS